MSPVNRCGLGAKGGLIVLGAKGGLIVSSAQQSRGTRPGGPCLHQHPQPKEL